MTERDEKVFSDIEKEGIAQAARDVARGGEEVLWQVTRAKVKLMKLAVAGYFKGATVDRVFYTPEDLMHEVELISEVTQQADFLLRFEGRDYESEIERRRI